MLNVLPEVAKETCFALHGGTVINLFVRDMPRLSVDIDLTYIPIENRTPSLQHITESLERIKSRIEHRIFGIDVKHKQDIGKLLISLQGISIKIEVNLVGRGTIEYLVKMNLCAKAEAEFDAFVAMQIMPIGQLYGGKICAALDRQHPRDLFDIKYLLDNEGFSEQIKRGFLLCLIGGDRPIHEVINPQLQDQRATIENQFLGMSTEKFTYDDYIQVREVLIKTINNNLTVSDKKFLLSIKNLNPDWAIHDFERFPAIQWKLKNLEKLKILNPEKHQSQYRLLEKSLA